MEKAKQTTKALYELSESYIELHRAIKSTSKEAAQSKKLWREGNKSNLTKIGVALIVFPEPTPFSEMIGAGFVLAGAVQKGIQSRSAYLGDIKKNFEQTIRELNSTQF